MRTVLKPEDFDTDTFVTQAFDVYNRKYRESFEHECPGKIVAIEVDSESAFVGDSVIEAGTKARRKFPDRIFHFIRVGAPYVYKRTW